MRRLTQRKRLREKNGLDELGIYHKLGLLEDLEEEIGLDFETIYKAINNGIYYKDHKGNINFIKSLGLAMLNKANWCLDTHKFYVLIKDYKDKWALTEEELEND